METPTAPPLLADYGQPHVKRVLRARKARPEHGIEVGVTYYWWHDERYQQHFSLTPPTPDQYLWPETRERYARQAAEQAEHRRVQAQRKEWTDAFLARYFSGRAPKGSWDGLKAANWKPEDGGPAPRADAAVEVCHSTKDRFRSYQHVSGEPGEVAAYIQHAILSDGCTQMYEHMLLDFVSVTSESPFTVLLSSSGYAGD